MTNCSKLLSESKSECNKKHQRRDTTRLAETNMKERENIETLNYGYMQHLEILFGTKLAT